MLDESPAVQTFENPPDTYYNWQGALFFIIMFLFFFLLYIIVPNPLLLIYGFFGSLMVPIIIVQTEYVSRPLRVHIDKDGMRLEYRLFEPKDVQWEDIEWIYVSPNKYTTVTGKDKRRGIIQLKKKRSTTLVTYEIGMAIRSAYQRYHGPLPELPGDWKNRPY
jgi:hypothetical protein